MLGSDAGQRGVESYSALLIDDDGADRTLIRRCIRRANLSISLDEAIDAASGLKACRERMYDFILLDYRLPDAEGFDFLETIQEIKSPQCAVILLTGFVGNPVAEESQRLGAVGFVDKNTLDPESFRKILTEALERQRGATP